MGDRSNVLFRNGESGVGVYAHWGGVAMAEAVMDVLSSKAFQARIGDPSYATRIGIQIVLQTLGADPTTETGFGIWTPECGSDDNEYGYIIIDVLDGAVYVSRDYREVQPEDRIDPPTEEAIQRAMQSG